MNIEKAINELQFQFNTKEVKEQHYPVQLSASDAEKILALLKEQKQDRTPKRVNFDRECEVYPNVWVRKGFCPQCHQTVHWLTNRSFCGFCGQEVIWN